MLDKLRSADFLPHLNTIFRIHLDGVADSVDLELVKVTESGSRSTTEAKAQFSLLFLGPPSPEYLIQHIYHLEHEQMEALDLFIVPHGLEKGRMQYEAIFT